MSKIGLLVECGRDGLEVVMCRRICKLMFEEHGSDLEVDIVPMDNKERLLEECGTAAASLLANGCDRVVILWDERPAWPKMGAPLCWHNDREQIRAELKKARVPLGKAHPVCIEREFESWLLFDDAMLSCTLSTAAHPVRVPRQKHPDQMPNPKGAMTTLFRKLAGKTYVDIQFARRFAECLTDLNRLRRCETFERFEAKILGTN